MWEEPRLLLQAPGCPPSTLPPTPAASCGWASGEAGKASSRADSPLSADQAPGCGRQCCAPSPRSAPGASAPGLSPRDHPFL